MPRADITIGLACWKPELAAQRVAVLSRHGFRADTSFASTSGMVGRVLRVQPAAIVIDLDRLPAYGREVGHVVRQSKSTRHVPLVFAGGAPEKVAAIRRDLPDAVFTTWDEIGTAVRQAIANAPDAPIAGKPHMERFAAAPLIKKLDVRPGMQVPLRNDHYGVREILEAGDLPDGAALTKSLTTTTKLALWVAASIEEAAAAFEEAQRLPAGTSLWIISAKASKTRPLDFNQQDIRLLGLDAGWTDYKVCSVSPEWSGLKFTRKK